jgi:hypothetical protein
MLEGEVFLFDVGVGGIEGLGNEVAVDAVLGEFGADASLAEFLIGLAEAGELLGVAGVVEEVVFLEAGDDAIDFGFAILARLHAVAHEALEVRNGAHAAAEGIKSIGMQCGLGEGLSRSERFAATEGHG